MRKLVLAATALTAVASISNAVDVKLYGVVNKSLMMHDDGISTESTIVDNNNESTRFGLAGEHKLDNGLTASVLFENQMQSNASNAVTQAGTGTNNSQANTPANTTATLTERMARVGIQHDAWGALFIGQQDVASDDAFAHDLTAATSVLNANFASYGGAMVFQRKTGNTASNLQAAATNLTPNLFSLGNNGDLAGADSIRYNSPNLMGFNGSLSVSQGGNIDANIRYAGEFSAFKVDGALANTWINNNTTTGSNEQVGTMLGSVSVLHNSGLGATVAYGSQDLDHKVAGVKEANTLYTKVGYGWDSYGVAAEYSHSENPIASATVRQELDVWGVGADKDLGNGVVVGAIYRNMNPKVTGITNEKSISLGAVNMRVKF